MKRLIGFLCRKVLGFLILVLGICMVVIGIYFRKPRRPNDPPRLVWGPAPLLNNKYWSNALKKAGYNSITLMRTCYSISNKEDFDRYWDEIVPASECGLLNKIYECLSPYIVFVYAIRNFDIVHHSFAGGFLADTRLRKLEAVLLKKAGCRIIIIGYGADHYQYSQVMDRSLLHGLLSSYPQQAREEEKIRNTVRYWTKHADVILGGYGGGSGRWDALPVVTITIDDSQWLPRREYSTNDGKHGKVTVIHTPNHRAFKGTEFLVQAVKQLRDEGLMVELIIVENRPNTEVLRLMSQKADILAEQFIASTYALSGIEGMASGLPVLANLDHEVHTRVFRRYSYLNECPILSTPPERLKENLRILVMNPKLREELGRAGRRYVEKYHSEETARYLFGSIYDKIWYGKDVDLMDLFHPLKSEYNRLKPVIQHPLVENRLPESYFSFKASENH